MKSMLKSLMSVAVAALALTSCSTDATDEVIAKGELKTLKVTASIDQTRTTLAGDHVKLNWSDDDVILFYIGEKATTFNKINPSTGGTVKDVVYENGNNVYANYSLDNEKYSTGVTQAQINIAQAQTQSEANVFAGENLPMVAKGTIANGAVDLKFKPVGCVLVFNVYGKAYNANEQIKSIKFETSVGCYGYQKCDLTADKLNYAAYDGAKDKSVTVTLTTPAAIGAQKPSDTKKGESQVYMVVAPVNYSEATITVNTTVDPQKGDIYNTYTFTTASGIDCSANTARVVNLNLANATVVPSIDVPTVGQQESKGGDLVIENVVFKNLDVKTATVGVYSDKELTQPLESSWLTIANDASLADGVLNCEVAANTTTASRTAYIGIKCAGVQAAIAVTQVAPGASTEKYYVKVTKALDDWTGDYLIVYENSDTEAYVWSLKDAAGCYITATPSNLGILSNETTDNCKVAISKSGNGYLLYATAGENAKNYIYRDEGKNGIDFGTKSNAESYLNTITFETSYIKIESSGISFQFYKSGSSSRFRYYKTNQQKVQLYKLQ